MLTVQQPIHSAHVSLICHCGWLVELFEGGMGVMVAGKYRVEVGTDFSADVLVKLLDVLERRR